MNMYYKKEIKSLQIKEKN